jgi:hypothetical protein
MTDHQNNQRRLFPNGNGGDRTIAPGDWLSVEHDGKTIVGMIYRCEAEAFKFVYWDNRILRFGTATREQIGPWNEELTAQFRGQIAVIPNYVERCMAEWMMQPEERIKLRQQPVRWESVEQRRPKVQKRLFPEPL